LFLSSLAPYSSEDYYTGQGRGKEEKVNFPPQLSPLKGGGKREAKLPSPLSGGIHPRKRGGEMEEVCWPPLLENR